MKNSINHDVKLNSKESVKKFVVALEEAEQRVYESTKKVEPVPKVYLFAWHKLKDKTPEAPAFYYVVLDHVNLFEYRVYWWYDKDKGFYDPRVVAWAEIPKYEE